MPMGNRNTGRKKTQLRREKRPVGEPPRVAEIILGTGPNKQANRERNRNKGQKPNDTEKGAY